MTTRMTIIAAAAAFWIGAAGSAAAQVSLTDGPRFNGWDGPKPQIDCDCRHVEGRAELGAVVCILRGGRRVLARCEKSLNIPFWRILEDGCYSPVS